MGQEPGAGLTGAFARGLTSTRVRPPLLCVHPESHLGKNSLPSAFRLPAALTLLRFMRKAGSWLAWPTARLGQKRVPLASLLTASSKDDTPAALSHSTDCQEPTCPSCAHEDGATCVALCGVAIGCVHLRGLDGLFRRNQREMEYLNCFGYQNSSLFYNSHLKIRGTFLWIMIGPKV